MGKLWLNIIGGGIGWALGGPIGAIFGVIASNVLSASKGPLQTHVSNNTQEGDFNIALLVLSVHIVRADNKIHPNEIRFVHGFLENRYGSLRSVEFKQAFESILNQEFDIQAICFQIRQNMDHASKMQLVAYLCDIALSDGDFSEEEKFAIRELGVWIGLHEKEISSLWESSRPLNTIQLEQAFTILELPNTASFEEIKKAYKLMARKHHPDTVAHLGEDHVAAAQIKFQKIQESYSVLTKHFSA